MRESASKTGTNVHHLHSQAHALQIHAGVLILEFPPIMMDRHSKPSALNLCVRQFSVTTQCTSPGTLSHYCSMTVNND